MEIILAVFLGVWISLAGVFAFFWLKREYRPYMSEDDKEGRDNE